MEIILQTNASEKICINKNITDIVELSGNLKAETSIIDPVIIVQADLEDLIECNYATINAFGRSYFVTNIRSIRTGLVELSMHVDVLSSFADEILENRGIISKQENIWNLYLDDGTFKTYQNPTIITKEFTGGFTTQQFILAVAGS